ncbi:acetyltransferase (GNAT) family protein [Kordia periserrulae]|uniref:Acetyltransferase (GNAT) family protein n=1 Tax=Kordia periserrulae TaxID=701523 RepID=A0A2T6BVH1_9FLAO|nr:GNAT family N-acetyltransferase [Kordia periserrulae]PTX60075.1 acetyltransferase (GNAT) family protein [Kordia periserrulae]
MNFTIRKAVATDVDAIFRLINELAIFEKEADAVIITPEDLQKDGFGAQPKFHCFVAETTEEVLGIALVYMRYSTWKGEVLHLEDLIVSEKARGKGIGGALLTEVIKFGKELGVKRIGWEVLDWNTPAIEFYEHIGANVMRDWHVVQLDEAGIEKYLLSRK